jgi:hypothetical protein
MCRNNETQAPEYEINVNFRNVSFIRCYLGHLTMFNIRLVQWINHCHQPLEKLNLSDPCSHKENPSKYMLIFLNTVFFLCKICSYWCETIGWKLIEEASKQSLIKLNKAMTVTLLYRYGFWTLLSKQRHRSEELYINSWYVLFKRRGN